MNRVRIFDADTIDQLSWPADECGELARRYLLPIVKAGTEHYVGNISCRMLAMSIDGLMIPIVIGQEQASRCWTCSVYSHYVEYAKAELAKLKNPAQERILKAVISGAGEYLKSGKVDRVVYVNNWLLPTNPSLGLSLEQIEAITRHLERAYPQHAIVFRSVEGYFVPDYVEALKANGYRMLGARVVYVLNPADESYLSRRNIVRDLKLLDKTAYEIVDPGQVCAEDVGRIQDIYNKLYIVKYSQLNPQFKKTFFEHVVRSKGLQFIGFRRNGRIDAFACWYRWGPRQVGSIIGYDTALPLELGLYRLALAVFIEQVRRTGLPINMSGGADLFKRTRGAVPVTEYNAVYYRHLAPDRQFPWHCLRALYGGSIFNKIAAKM